MLSGARDFAIENDLLARARKQVQVPAAVTVHDTELGELIEEAAELVEYETAWILAGGTFNLDYDCWPAGEDPIEIHCRPVTAINSITYYDDDTAQRTFSASLYRFDNGRVWPVIWRADFDVAWPSLASDRRGVVTVNFEAGASAASTIPTAARIAVLSRVARLWNDRGYGDLGSDGFGNVFLSAVNQARSSGYL